MVTNVKSKLDKSKPYGEVWGQVEGVIGARYSQGTKLFNAGGEEVHDFAPAPVVEPEVPPAPAPVVEPEPEAPVVEPEPEAPALPGIPAKKK